MSDSHEPRRDCPGPVSLGTAPIPGQEAEASIWYHGDLARRRPGRFTVVVDDGIAAIHAGPVVQRAGGYVGAALNVGARLTALASPGQILCTEPVRRAVRLAGVSYRALGPARLKNIQAPIDIFEVVAATAEEPPVDPVCRMQVSDAVAVELWEGRSYHFCSADCAAAFRARPSDYASG